MMIVLSDRGGQNQPINTKPTSLFENYHLILCLCRYKHSNEENSNNLLSRKF